MRNPMNKRIVSALFVPFAFLFAVAACNDIESTESEGDVEEELEAEGPEADPQVLYKCCWRYPNGVCGMKVEAHRACP